MRIIKRKFKIKVEAEFGSEYQKSFALNGLRMMLDAWTTYLQNSHKKNKIFWIWDNKK